RARTTVAESARFAESTAERAGAARNDVQRIDGDLALLNGQTSALREALERAEAEIATREAATDLPPLPNGFSWLHERIASSDAIREALGGTVALTGAASDAPGPKGMRGVAE